MFEKNLLMSRFGGWRVVYEWIESEKMSVMGLSDVAAFICDGWAVS